MYLNKSFIYGNLTRDPELRALPNGGKVTTFSVATNRVYKDSNNNKKEEVEYHNVVVFGKQAETCAQYLKKGQGVLVEGRIQTRSWDDKNSGEKKYRTEIVAEAVQFGQKVSSSPREAASSNPKDASASSLGSGMDLSDVDFGDAANIDDIPF